jgi:hypothetical protein
VDEQPDKRDEAGIDAAQAIHREADVGAKRADLHPRPDVVENHLWFAHQRAVRPESKPEGERTRDGNGKTCDRADERFALDTSPDEPVDGCADERRENDVTKHKFQESEFRIQ